MATQTTWPPGFAGSSSGAAATASSWSRASAGSMVTSGRSRRSVRSPSSTGRAAIGLGQRVLGELVGDAVLVDGDQRDRLRGRGVAEAGDDAGARQAVGAGGADLLGLDQLAVAGAGAVAGADQPVAVGLLVDRGDAAAALGVVVDAEHALGAHADAADHPGGERGLGAVERGHPAEQAVAGAERGVVLAGEHQDARGGAVALPLGGLGPEVAGVVGAGDAEHQHRRQVAGGGVAAAALLHQAVAGHLGEQLLQLDLGGALQPEGAGDLALAGLGRVVAEPGEDLVGAGEVVHVRGVTCARGAGIRELRASPWQRAPIATRAAGFARVRNRSTI